MKGYYLEVNHEWHDITYHKEKPSKVHKNATIEYVIQMDEYNKLQARLKAAEDCLRFYGDKNSWVSAVVGGWINIMPLSECDEDIDPIVPVAGKRARDYFKKYEGK